MNFSIHHLESIQDVDVSLGELPGKWPRFLIPVLPEKPQDPIMDSLHLWRKDHIVQNEAATPANHCTVSDELFSESNSEDNLDNIWTKAVHEPSRQLDLRLSWDTLRRPSFGPPIPSAFLSERSPHTLTAVRHYVDPPFDDPLTQSIFTLPSELLESLQMTLVGISSPLHVWDAIAETFTLRGVHPGRHGTLVISGMDETVSHSLIQRFLTVGTLIRRLERVVADLRESSVINEISLHAFAHALSSVLRNIKNNVGMLTQSCSEDGSNADLHTLSTTWMACGDTERILEHLANLCGRDITLHPAHYQSLPKDTPTLLSALYESLEYHLDSHSSRVTTAVLAYLLTETSVDYLERICLSVGYGRPSRSHQLSVELREQQTVKMDDDNVQDETNHSNDYPYRSFPCFFAPEMSQALVRARKSLHLLRMARPNHPLAGAQSHRQIRWIWTKEEITHTWQSSTESRLDSLETSTTVPPDLTGIAEVGSEVGFQVFKLFDKEPGTHLATVGHIIGSSANTGFQTFLKMFPQHLPSLTPSLSHLAELILSPLSHHLDALSVALVDIFLSDGYLSLHAHMTLLRSYMLLTSQAFKSRLQSALFSDVFETETTNAGARSIAASGSRPSSGTGHEHNDLNRWVIGLAPGLTEDGWPPAGADLRYQLRTVIIDSLDIDHPDRQISQQAASDEEALIYEEADWRLGFAIRDLPTGSGHAKWLNPTSMEALDFLYMDYQPPPPLDVLITPPILSKYHRLFAFNLRLMRVESVVNTLFRMTLRGSTSPFPTFTSSQKLFLHFRFLVGSFVTSLTSYVYDTAIGSTYDAFLKKISNSTAEHDGTFSDVFKLADSHSRTMDNILSACLLRSSQKAVGDILRSTLNIILEFGILISDRQRGTLQEYEATAPLEGLFQKFIERLKTLIKTLKTVIDKGSSSLPIEDALLNATAESLVLPQLVGVEANLHNLLVRLDVSMWWVHQ